MLSKIIYTPILLLAQACLSLYLRQINPKIWPRNSYALNRLVFLKSDIDLTLYFEKKLDHNDLLKIRSAFFILNKSIPLFSEFNIYDQSSNFKFLNSCEKQRDILLKVQERPNSVAQRIVFILRMIWGDKTNLTSCPAKRVKKWQGHFDDLNLGEIKPVNIENILQPFKEQLPEKFFNFYLKLLQLKITDINSINRFYQENTNQLKNFILSSPAQWIGASIANNQLIQELEQIKTFTSLEKEIIKEHIYWEFWGLETQRHLNFDDSSVQPHKENLQRVLEVIT